MSSFLVLGYKNFELGIFSSRDPKLNVIKKAIRQDLIRLFEEGVDWLVFQGNLGFETWCLEEALDLKNEGYEVGLACIFPFEDHGKNWSESNQLLLQKFKQVDYLNHSFLTYTNPSQLRQHQEFLLKNTSGVYLFYDEENETNLSYFYKRIQKEGNYPIKQLTFERLNELAQNWE